VSSGLEQELEQAKDTAHLIHRHGNSVVTSLLASVVRRCETTAFLVTDLRVASYVMGTRARIPTSHRHEAAKTRGTST
jgi:hypothetical protein